MSTRAAVEQAWRWSAVVLITCLVVWLLPQEDWEA